MEKFEVICCFSFNSHTSRKTCTSRDCNWNELDNWFILHNEEIIQNVIIYKICRRSVSTKSTVNLFTIWIYCLLQNQQWLKHCTLTAPPTLNKLLNESATEKITVFSSCQITLPHAAKTKQKPPKWREIAVIVPKYFAKDMPPVSTVVSKISF